MTTFVQGTWLIALSILVIVCITILVLSTIKWVVKYIVDKVEGRR